MTVEAAIIQLLIADSGVSAIVGDSVWPGSKPQASGFPAIVVNWIEGEPIYTADGETGLNRVRFEIDAWAETYTGAKDLAAAVKTVLSAFQGTNSGVTIETALFESERDYREGGSNSDEYLFRSNLDLTVWYR